MNEIKYFWGSKNCWRYTRKTHKLVKIHTFLESIDDPKEDQYKETLLKLDKDSLNILLKKPQTEILDLLQKSDIQLKSILIQAQIDELEAKGLENLTEEELCKDCEYFIFR